MKRLLQSSEAPGHNLDFGNVAKLADSIPSPPQASNSDFDPKVFWSVNAFILFLIFLTGVWCCFVQKFLFNRTDQGVSSDQFYRERQQRRQEAARSEPPEKRRYKLHASFVRHKVQMTVKEEDLIITETKEGKIEAASNADGKQSYSDIETGVQDASLSFPEEESGQLRLRNGRLVPNCCAVCLSPYNVGDIVTWSSNPECVHAFHRECVVDWLIKMQPETPCPCCRQEFTDLEEIRKERKIKWLGTVAFDINAVRFW